jgi:hypothetical protein
MLPWFGGVVRDVEEARQGGVFLIYLDDDPQPHAVPYSDSLEVHRPDAKPEPRRDPFYIESDDRRAPEPVKLPDRPKPRPVADVPIPDDDRW